MGRSKKNAGDQSTDAAAAQGAMQKEQAAAETADPDDSERRDAETSNAETSDAGASGSKSADSKAGSKASAKSASKAGRSRKTTRKSAAQRSTATQRSTTADATWNTTEELLNTLNQELGGLKEYVLADLRGEITSLRSRKLQLETEIQRLENDRDQLLSQRERNLTEQEQAQQQQWAQQFSQVMAQNLRQELQAQLLGDGNGEPVGAAQVSSRQIRPEQQLLVFREQIAGMESALVEAIAGIRQELGRHESDLSQQVLRMQDLERQGEVILAGLLQRLKNAKVAEPPPSPPEQMEQEQMEQSEGEEAGLSPISFTLGSTSTTGIAASLRARTETGPVPTPADFPADWVTSDAAPPAPSESTKSTESTEESTASPAPGDAAASNPTAGTIPTAGTMPAAMGQEPTATISDFPADVLFGRPPSPPAESSPPPPTETPTISSADAARIIPPFDADRVVTSGPPEPPWADSAEPEADPLEPDPFQETEGVAEPDAFASESPTSESPTSESLESRGESGGWVTESEDEAALADEVALEEPELDSRSRFDTAQLPGFISAALSLLLLSLQYSTVHIIFHGVPWLSSAAGGLMPSSWASALLTFWIRMLMVLPFMIVIGQGIYPPLLEEMQELFRTRDRRPLISIVFSSFLLFLSQFLLYRAIGTSSASVAVGLLFVYPAAVNVLGVGLFRRRMAQSSWLTLLPIGLGGMILLVQSGSIGGLNPGIISAICFALYALVGRLYTRRLNVLTLTVMQFGLAWLFSMPALLFLRSASPVNDVGYVVACLVLSLTVFLSYLFNTASLNRLGPAWTSIINGWTPLLVAFLGIIISPGDLSVAQGLGVLLVTLGVTALNLERLRR